MQDFKEKLKLENKRIEQIKQKFDKTKILKELEDLKAKSNEETLWNNPQQARKIMKNISSLEHDIEMLESLELKVSDIDVMIELLDDKARMQFTSATDLTSEQKEVELMLEDLGSLLDKIEINVFLNDKFDQSDAILSIHAGQGGTEANDWSEMLMRMYLMYFQKLGFSVEITNLVKGNEAGINTVTMEVSGRFAYGYLKREYGTHRLVRISPFNAQGLRQTSFALVEVMPIIEDAIEVNLNMDEIEFSAVRSSGAGGQNVNKVATAVRLTHVPTGITVSCSTERSQLRNKEFALNMLKGKLYNLELEKQESEKKELKGEHKIAGWGNQIRNYVLHPYKLVKDLRTNVESQDPESVLNGDLDKFIEAEIKL